jgi:BASS family bile acid:Na+ symporter
LLKAVVDAGVPALVFFAMVVVGMELTADDFRRLARRPGIVVAATVGQLVLLPVIGWALVQWLGLHVTVARGLLLVAACPSGGMANVYTYLGRANVALSVSLTALSCLAALLSMPLVLAVFEAYIGDAVGFSVPLGTLVGQLFLLLIFPIFTGMAIRRCRPEITARHGRALLAFSIVALVALLALIIAEEAEHFAGALADIAATSTLLTGLAFGAGWATGWMSGAGPADRFTVGMVFVVRNVGVATALAVTVLGRVEFAVFATAYFIAQAPILVVAVLLFRYSRVAANFKLEGAESS